MYCKDILHLLHRDVDLDALKERGYFDFPASLGHHGNVQGGLFQHSYNVATTLLQYNLEWVDDSWISPLKIGFLHDICKLDDYMLTSDGTFARNERALPGHADKSIHLIWEWGIAALNEQEELCIRYHMGAFTDKEKWSQYTNAIHRDVNVLWTHHADMMAAHVLEIHG